MRTVWSSTFKMVAAFSLLMLRRATCAQATAQQKPEQLAQQSSESWLALVDSGKYAESWQECAQIFQAAVTKEQWPSALRATRDPLGKLLSRKLKGATYTKTLPGAPDGEYVVISVRKQFRTQASGSRDGYAHAG